MKTLLPYFCSDDYKLVVKTGVCAVFSNEYFKKLSRREGTAEDVKELQKVFEDHLGFDFIPNIDLTKSEMELKLRKYAGYDNGDDKGFDYTDYDAFVCFILTHGRENVILTADDQEIELDIIRTMFLRSRKLIGKPKLFFVQACQGSGVPRFLQIEDDGIDSQGLCETGEISKPEKQFNTSRIVSDSVGEGLPEGCDIRMEISASPGKHLFHSVLFLRNDIAVRLLLFHYFKLFLLKLSFKPLFIE